MSSAQHKKVIESHVVAVCAHNIDEIMSYYDPNCEVSFDGQVVMRSKDDIKSKTEKWLLDPNYKVEIVDFLPVEGDDRVRFIATDTNNKRFEEICVFSKEGKFIQLMVTSLNK
ncbi:unnamed protein product [Adineta steineri]|uniref:Nuclear transport factor 2 family protein n=2 Tax=Adineta steineri TaxID=433720 RepID=A0A819P712_9BILA|nr:unnamed protein product [Adineta steineri]CAF4009082.1 unnamed protein product [Adineta steineri]CAF4011542.1 unnamed protein product [Adineta steineri]